jgi:hypothetical protein
MHMTAVCKTVGSTCATAALQAQSNPAELGIGFVPEWPIWVPYMTPASDRPQAPRRRSERFGYSQANRVSHAP